MCIREDFEATVRKADASRGRSISGNCPGHDDKHKSLSVKVLKHGKILIHCFAGCDNKPLVRDARRILGLRSGPREVSFRAKKEFKSDAEFYANMSRKLWEKAKPLRLGDPATRYLQNRLGAKLFTLLTRFPASLRYHHAVYCNTNDTIRYLPALLARIDSPQGELVCVHRTYITMDGYKDLANTDGSPKRLMACSPGSTKGGAIRLFPAGSVLGIAEGLETALAVALTQRMPVWAAVSASGLRDFQPPPSVKELLIFGDNDKSGAGQNAAEELAKRMSKQGITVRKIIPPLAGQDWLDIAITETSA